MAAKKSNDETYTDAEIEARLKKDLPEWYLEAEWIRRKYRTASWKGTLLAVNAIGHLAEQAWHHPDLTVSYGFVIVKLTTHSHKGVTNRDFELAQRIEETLMWQPPKDSALEGTPNDPRFAYIRHK